MGQFELILGLSAVVLGSAVVNQIFHGLAAPLIQIALGALLVILNVFPSYITVNPDLFLVLFIAPLLFKEARDVNKISLWNNRSLILSLAIGLVLVTILVVGFVVHAIEPSIPLAAAFALGAALGPTDAVAVTSLSHTVKLKKSQNILLQGECLINDASGVVSFQFAIAAMVTGSFSMLEATTTFFVSFFGGIFMGTICIMMLVLVATRVRKLGLEDNTFHVLLDILTPFVVFLAAEACHVSGILAVVAAGLIQPLLEQGLSPDYSRMKIISTSVWKVFSFALNGIVFVLLGMQLPRAMMGTWEDISVSGLKIFILMIVIAGVSLTVRTLWFMGINFVNRYRRAKEEQRLGGGTSEQIKEVLHGVHFWTKESTRDSAAMAIAGPKGAITLSIVFTIPYVLQYNGAAFPQRDLLIFLASGVILITLLLANFLLPILVPSNEEASSRNEEAPLTVMRIVMEELTARQTKDNKRATQMVVRQYNDRIRRFKRRNDIEKGSDIKVRLMAYQWEKDFVMDLIDREEVSPLAGYAYIRHINRAISLVQHVSPSQYYFEKVLKRITMRWRYVVRLFRERTLIDNMINDESRELHELQIRVMEYVAGRLERLLLDKNSNTEDVATLLIEVQANLRRLKISTSSFAAAAKLDKQVIEIKRRGLRMELECIQELFESGEIDHATARHMRENVSLMQLDLEEKI